METCSKRKHAIAADDYPPRFPLALAHKDANLIIEATATVGLDLRLAPAAQTWLDDAVKAGWGTYDYTADLAQILASRPNSTQASAPQPA